MPDKFDLTFENKPGGRVLDALERDRVLADPGFGQHFTDHMVSINWDVEQGWHDARVEAFGDLAISPAASVLHYAPEIFEGMKAYRWADGSIHLFRPELNAARFVRSAERMALPALHERDFLTAVHALVAADHDWVPTNPAHTLYVRPFMFADEPYFGIRSTQRAQFHVIASPAGDYFVRPLRLWVESQWARASKRGTGEAKFGGNYAASALPLRRAHERGFDQVLFLDAETGTRVDEAGSMNVFFVTKNHTLVTPALTGAILDGITRRSILQLARDRGMETQERTVAAAELFAGVRNGEIVEAFAAGTAAVVTPIASFTSDAETAELTLRGESLALALREELISIQFGRTPDRHGWTQQVATR